MRRAVLMQLATVGNELLNHLACLRTQTVFCAGTDFQRINFEFNSMLKEQLSSFLLLN